MQFIRSGHDFYDGASGRPFTILLNHKAPTRFRLTTMTTITTILCEEVNGPYDSNEPFKARTGHFAADLLIGVRS